MAEFMAIIIFLVIIMIYRNIRNLREDKDLTQQDMADILHINRRTYSAYENGVNAMTPETLIKIAEFHNTSIDYLLGRTSITKPYPTE